MNKSENLSRDDMLEKAINYHNEGNIDEAIKLYLLLSQDYPEMPDVLNLLGVARSQIGQYGKAVETINKAIQINPTISSYYTNLALVHINEKKFDNAIKVCELALHHGISESIIYFLYGNCLYEKNEYSDAVSKYRKANELNPNDPEIYFNIGSCLRETNQHNEAISAFKNCIQLDVNNVDAYNNIGNLYRISNRLDESEKYLNKALVYDPDYVPAMANLAVIYINQKKYDEALTMCNRILQINPEFSLGHNYLGKVNACLKQYEEALIEYEKAIELEPDNAEINLNLGDLYISIEKYDRAKYFIEKSIKLNPEYAKSYSILGNLLMFEGQIEKGCQMYEKALQLNPELSEARINLISYGKINTDDKKQITLINERIATVNDIEIKAGLVFSLGKIYDNMKDYDKAFEMYSRANHMIRQTVKYSPVNHQEEIERIKSIFSKGYQNQIDFKGDLTRKPVLILGMPRSGTTLVEQIISSHPQACGAGEQGYFFDIFGKIKSITGGTESYPDCIYEIKQNHADIISSEYVNLLNNYSEHANKITDKSLINYLYLGLINLLFPNAYIINCKRNPIDTCFSIYSLKFTENIDYAYDLSEIGARYYEYLNIMKHWEEVLPTKIYNVNYEKLIENQEDETKKLIKFLELPWDERCLKFYETERSVKTASLSQVRQPIYQKSVEKWKNYEKYLGKLISALENGCR